MLCSNGIAWRANTLYHMFAFAKFGHKPVFQTSVRTCSVTKEAERLQHINRGYEILRRQSSSNSYLSLSSLSRINISCLLQRNPLTNDERSVKLLTHIEADEANNIAVQDIEPESNTADDQPILIPKSPAADNPYRESREKLPIFSRRQEILDLIEANQVIVLSGATGSGKTTQVPQYIMEDCAAKQKHCRIICTQPRRLATTSIASRVSVERGDQLGNSIGYQIRLKSKLSRNTNLIFTTSGFLLRRMIGESSGELLKNITHLIFDEVHERDDITDFLLIAIKDALKEHPHLKVIVMSATLDADIFCKYFADCPRIDVPGRMFPVEIVHLKELLDMTGYKTKEMDRIMNIHRATDAELASKAWRPSSVIDESSPSNGITLKQETLYNAYCSTSNPDEINHDFLFEVIKQIHNSKSTDGSILVFLPGIGDITEQQHRILNGIPSKNYELYILHSSLNGTDRNDQDRVFDKPPTGHRKIILSTNIAETSLTINDVAYVIDAGKAKLNKFDFRSQTALLQSAWISKACAKQRAGRAGRTQSGICYRLYSAEDYEAMDEYTQPEILRVPLTDICLNSKILFKRGSIEEFLLKAIQPPPINSIRKSVALLQSIDALDDQERITSLGVHLAKLPVDAQIGKCILYAILLKCVDPIVTIVSMLSANNPFEMAIGRDGSNQKMTKRCMAGDTYSDHMVKLTAFKGWHEAKMKKNEKEFSFENYLIDDNMVMVHGVRSLILGHLKRLRLLNDERDSNENSEKWPVVKACLTAGFYPNICRIHRNEDRFKCNNDLMLVHKSSVIGRSNGKIKKEFLLNDVDWVIFGAKHQSLYINSFLIEDVTPVSAVNLALFGGPINLVEPRSLQNPQDEYLFSINQWIQLCATEADAQMVFSLRQKLNGILTRMLRLSKEFTTSGEDDDIISTVVNVLQHEDKHCGL